MNAHRQRHERGQVLVIVAMSMVAVVAMVGLVIDGGYAWGKQRDTQNGADAASEAGAIVMAERLAGVVPAKTDADVLAAVHLAGTENGMNPPDAWYTNITGDLLTPVGGVTTNRALAAKVGAGTIPTGAAGVEAIGAQTFNTFLVRIIGFQQLTVTAPATAVAGYIQDVCSAQSGCDVLPVTFPVTIVGCDAQGNAVPIHGSQQWTTTDAPLTIPLCKNGPGNVGWLDWTPTAGGTSELIQSILHPDNKQMTTPDWFYVTSTGNINSKPVEDAINNTWGGKTVLIPQFDGTCDAAPTGPALDDCPLPNVGGHGQNQYYHLPQFAAFQLCGGTPNWCNGSYGTPPVAGPSYAKGAYINGNDKATCDTGNGGTSCLAGRFVNFLGAGGPYTVGPGSGAAPATNLIGVQLLR